MLTAMNTPAHTLMSYDAALRRLPGQLRTPEAARTRLGVILPSVNTVVEPWFTQAVAPDVRVHATRMLLASEVTAESLRRMDHEEGLDAARRIASCRPDAIAYCCTASSIVQGLDYDRRLRQSLEEATGRPCFTAVGAIIEALQACGARRIAIASPYTDAIDHAEKAFFEEAGFQVLNAANLNIADSFALASPDARQMYELAQRAWHPDADALLISCLNMNAQQVVGLLEQQLDRPVITSTTATLWKLLRSAGRADRVPGYGRLLAGH
ncbi:hypothetical protein BBB44_02645 [Bordetella bronchiseptica]|nr:hypothetical protein BBB44_02645 [Bordetella bronchiseptica]AZW42487.1 hypothetical protein CWR61_02690 [Bordetella bronchiseptica]